VVQYRKAFVACWKEYAKHFHKWDNDGNPLPLPTSFPIPGGHFRLILVTHDELTFHQNNERKTHWAHSSTTATLKPKGNGQLLMVSDFLTVEWGHLCHGNECVFSLLDSCLCLTHPNTHSKARILFKAGKNWEGYFGADQLHQQVDQAIDIFEDKTNGWAQGLFMFDNAPSHQKWAPDAISARRMVKSESFLFRASCLHLQLLRPEARLDAPQGWPTHAPWLQPTDGRAPTIIFSPRSPHHAQMVQGHGTYHPGARSLARARPSC